MINIMTQFFCCSQDPLDSVVVLAQPDRLVNAVRPDRQEKREHQEGTVHKVNVVMLELQVQRVHPDLKVDQDQLVHKEKLDNVVKRDKVDKLVQLEHQVGEPYHNFFCFFVFLQYVSITVFCQCSILVNETI